MIFLLWESICQKYKIDKRQILTLNLENAIFWCLYVVFAKSTTHSTLEMSRWRKPRNILSFWREVNVDPIGGAQSYPSAQLDPKKVNLDLYYSENFYVHGSRKFDEKGIQICSPNRCSTHVSARKMVWFVEWGGLP